MEGSPESICVLRAVKGEPIDHLRDLLERIEVEFMKQKKAFKPLDIKIPFFEELIVSLAGLDVTRTAERSSSSSSSSSSTAAAASSSTVLSVSTALDAMLAQIGGEELVNRLRLFMEGCKKTNMSAETQRSRLRVLALALASFSVVSKVFITTLGASNAEILAARPSASLQCPVRLDPFWECGLRMWRSSHSLFWVLRGLQPKNVKSTSVVSK